MADVQKVKILDVNTSKSVKNVKTLKQQIRELKDQMALLEKGTEEYDRVAKQLADTMQKQTEIQEAAKYSNKDFGATMSNLTRVSAGVIGAFNGISAAMQMMGAESEDAAEAMKNIQLTMAIIQGLSAIDTARKSLEGLINAFSDLGKAKELLGTKTTFSTGAIIGEDAALVDNTAATKKNNDEASRFNEATQKNIDKTKDSINVLEQETAALGLNKATMEGDTEAIARYTAELEKLRAAQALATSNAQNLGFTEAINEYEKRIKNAQAMLKYHSQGMTSEVKMMYERQIKDYSSAITRMMHTSVTTTDDIMVAVEGSIDKLITASKGSFEDMEEEILTFNTLLKGLPFDDAQKKAQEANDFFERCIASFQQGAMAGAEGMEEAIKDFQDLQYILSKETTVTLNTLKQQEIREAELRRKILQTKEARDAETTSENLNADAKLANAGATEKAAAAEGKLNAMMVGKEPIFKKVGSAIKGIGKAIAGLVSANPILFGIAAAIGAITAALVIYTKNAKRANAEAKLMADMTAEVNHQFDEQLVRINTLVSTLDDHNSSMAEKKKVIEELNKIVPDYNGKLNETTGEYTANGKALQDYIDKLYVKLQLEVYESKIKEYLQQELEIQQKLNKLNNDGWAGWHRFWGQISKAEGDLQEVNSRIYEMTKLIKGLDLTKALDENKVTKATGKTLKEIVKEIKDIYRSLVETIYDEREFTAIYNGIYDKTEVLANRIQRLIRTKEFGKDIAVSPELQKLLDSGEHPVVTKFNVTADFIFGKETIAKFEETLVKEEEKLKKKVDDKGRKLTEKQLEDLKKDVELRKTQLANMKALAEAVQEYANYQTELAEGQKERARAEDEYSETLRIEAEYIKAVRSGDRYADIDKEIKSNELLLQTIYNRIDAEKQELTMLQSKAVLNKVEKERMEELEQKELENKKAKDNAERALDNAKYKRRLEELKKFYEDSENEYNVYIAELQSKRSLWGGGTEDYNTEYDVLKLSEQQLQKQLEYVDWYYETLIANAQGNAAELERLEVEKNGVMAELERQQAELSIEIDREKYARKINAAQAYYNALSSITGEIQGLLQEEMNGMDSNTKAYKEMRLTSARIDIASGILSAFMSGIQSGLPAPLNYGLGLTMATLVGLAGARQLENIRNENEANAMSASGSINIGTHYDTLSYQTQTDILSAIQDSRVYVLESDITSTQRRVRVAESQSTF